MRAAPRAPQAVHRARRPMALEEREAGRSEREREREREAVWRQAGSPQTRSTLVKPSAIHCESEAMEGKAYLPDKSII